MTAPVMYAAASLARNSTTPATSPAAANLPSGTAASIAFLRSSGSTAVMSVSTNPGAITFAVMFREPSSRASDLARPTRPAFDAA